MSDDEPEECGCCELGEYDGDPNSDEPWCTTHPRNMENDT